MFQLSPTAPAWADAALADLDALLADHLHCERKAASTALALVRAYPERPELVLHLSRLANEETSHMVEVNRRMRKRGAPSTRDSGDPYAQALRAQVRKGEPARQIDLLLVSSLIEARSAERLDLLAGALRARGELALAEFYEELAVSEHRHRDIFFALAQPLLPPEALTERLNALRGVEEETIAGLPWGPRVH